MVGQDVPLQEPLASEVTTALIEFGRLSQHAGSTAFDAPSTLANELLKRLVGLCKAQRGAVLLIGNLPDALLKASQAPTLLDSNAPGQQLSPSSGKPVRTLALHAIREEEVYALLTSFPPAAPVFSNTQTASDRSCWITYRLAIGDIPTETEKPLHPSAQSLQALLVLGWDGLEDGTRRIERVMSPPDSLPARGTPTASSAEAMERGRSLLPFVADAAAGVIVSILLAERVHALETAAEQQALREADSLKAELLGTMNHELRSPLAAIKGYAATLMRHEKRLSREERHEFLSAINQASDRLETIIERLLEMSELETGELTLDRSPVDLAHLAGEAIAALEERVAVQFPGRFTFRLSMEHANGTPARDVPLVSADLRHLREVLDYVLENAMKYSPKGGTISVVLRSATHVQASESDKNQQGGGKQAPLSSPNMVEVCVCDNGIGIPTEHLNRIFDRFHRVDTRLTREVDGLGLGLTICKRIVELHDGSIWAESSPGEGSKFYVLLPMANADAVE